MLEAFGSDFQSGSTADYTGTNTWASMGQILSITPPTQSADAITPPTPLNAASRAKTVLPGGVNPGTCGVVLVYAAGAYQTLKAKQGVAGSYRILFPTPIAKAVAFNGYISEIGMPEMNDQGFLQVTITIQVSGDAAEVAVTGGGT